MYDTQITIIGNVLNPPEWRRTTNTGTLVTTFKIASTARRLNRETGQWVDGNSLRVRINCWRALASNAFASVTVGDPLIVVGRLYTRDWVDDEGTRRTQYEVEATAIGHDLSRGRNRFERVKAATSTSAVEDAQAQQRIGGELTESVPAGQAPAQFDDTPYSVEDMPAPPAAPPIRYDPLLAPGEGRPLLAPDEGRPLLAPGEGRPLLTPGEGRPLLAPGEGRPRASADAPGGPPGPPTPPSAPATADPSEPFDPRAQGLPAESPDLAAAALETVEAVLGAESGLVLPESGRQPRQPAEPDLATVAEPSAPWRPESERESERESEPEAAPGRRRGPRKSRSAA